MTSLVDMASGAAGVFRSVYGRDPHAIMINPQQWLDLKDHLEPIALPENGRKIRKIAGYPVLACHGIVGPIAVSSEFAEKLIVAGDAFIVT